MVFQVEARWVFILVSGLWSLCGLCSVFSLTVHNPAAANSTCSGSGSRPQRASVHSRSSYRRENRSVGMRGNSSDWELGNRWIWEEEESRRTSGGDRKADRTPSTSERASVAQEELCQVSGNDWRGLDVLMCWVCFTQRLWGQKSRIHCLNPFLSFPYFHITFIKCQTLSETGSKSIDSVRYAVDCVFLYTVFLLSWFWSVPVCCITETLKVQAEGLPMIPALTSTHTSPFSLHQYLYVTFLSLWFSHSFFTTK